MRSLRWICLALLVPLQGCFFFYVPGSFIDAAADGISGKEGNHCVGTTAHVGDTVRMPDGSRWAVQKLEGESSRCRDSSIPIRAKLAPI